MEDDDPVVQEIPIFLSQALAKNLYIYQYPVKPANRNWKESNIINASVKPKNKLVRLEVGLDTYSDKFCDSKGEQIALNTDGVQESSRYIKDRDKEKSTYFKNGIMDKIVYESSNPCTDSDRYAVAILQDKELHCTPIQGIIQLRPSYSYFDKQDKRKKDSDKAENSDEEEEEVEAQQVTVKFSRTETDLAKKARESTFDYISKRAAEEPWHAGMWHHEDTDHADLERLKLFSANLSEGSSLSLRGREYVRALVPPPPPDEADAAPAAPEPPPDQARRLLLSAKIMTFAELRSLIRTEDGPLPDAALLSTLTATGCCVRGLWTCKSSDLFTRVSVAPAANMQAARDHVLYLFTQHSYIDRRKVAAAVRLPAEEVLEVIRSCAKYNPQKAGWELLLPPDTAFEAKYPDVVQRYNMYFEGRQRLFNEMMLGETVPKRQRKKSQRDSVSSDTMMSPKPRCNSVSEDDSDGRKRPKNKSASGSGKRTRNVSSSSAQDGA
ncbi:hypothetical protein JYU34_012905 [Plutella xylostella]|uniref:DNA-directed RNA polymerase III subunit RPC5 n=1 Tax=Plutella xylostella TaxID=51655 RepID=A0ABQ7QG28_PLUXY|nr:hypothetical protein JYU34_012905 [Plutella xylostella]